MAFPCKVAQYFRLYFRLLDHANTIGRTISPLRIGENTARALCTCVCVFAYLHSEFILEPLSIAKFRDKCREPSGDEFNNACTGARGIVATIKWLGTTSDRFPGVTTGRYLYVSVVQLMSDPAWRNCIKITRHWSPPINKIEFAAWARPSSGHYRVDRFLNSAPKSEIIDRWTLSLANWLRMPIISFAKRSTNSPTGCRRLSHCSFFRGNFRLASSSTAGDFF